MKKLMVVVALFMAAGVYAADEGAPDRLLPCLYTAGTSTTGQYIDTGIDAKNGTKAELDFSFTALSNCGLLTARKTTTTRFYMASYYSGITYGYGSVPEAASRVPADIGTRYTVTTVMEKGTQSLEVTSGETSVGSMSGTGSMTTGSYAHLYLFALNNYDGKVVDFASVCFYSCKIWQKDGNGDYQLVREFKPCIKDDEVCLYDAVEGMIYRNQGSGAFVAGQSPSELVEWTGADPTDPTDWFSPANWNGNSVPTAGDNVLIPYGASVVLSNTTPELASAYVAGTLVFTNWTTCLSATNVVVVPSGIITCAGPFTDTEMSNRVWIACADFTVSTGGKVDVTDKGYGKPTTVPIAAGAAWGPGKAETSTCGGAHGGYGGGGWAGDGTIYGSIDEPTTPGSTGKTKNGTNSAKGIPAGGVVRIDASGIVTINGAINANGHVSGSFNNSGAGSGGSILVYASKIVANGGSIAANGGNANNYGTMYPAGGGRIALHYDTSVQTAEDLVSLSVSAAGGRHYRTYGQIYPFAQADYNGSADIGTIWFSDAKPLKFLGASLTGQIYLGSGASYACDSIAMTSGWVRFAQDGFALTVTNDVTVSGTGARLEVGGGTYYRAGCWHHLRSGATPWSFTVGGDMTVTGGARLDLYAATTNGTAAAGGTLAVVGDLTIASDSKLYLSCDAQNGGAPLVTADNVTVAEGAVVSADCRGFAATFGPGMGHSYDGISIKKLNSNTMVGAGHGGIGNKADATYGKSYDDPVRPTMAGSGGKITYDTSSPVSGGGVVHLVAANDLTVNGSVSASAFNPVATTTTAADNASSGNGRFAAGSGGTVLLESKTFAMGASATVSAQGSDIKDGSEYFKNGGVSGGGRIAVWTGAPYVEGETKASAITVSEAQPAEWLGTFSAAGGYFTDSAGYGRKFVAAGGVIGVVIEEGVEVDHGEETAESDTWYECPVSEATVRGGDGTIRFVTVAKGSGMMIFVR